MFVWAVQLYRILRFLRVLHWISSWIRGNKLLLILRMPSNPTSFLCMQSCGHVPWYSNLSAVGKFMVYSNMRGIYQWYLPILDCSYSL